MIENYAIDIMIEYKNNNLGKLPDLVINPIIDQVKEVSQKLFTFLQDHPSMLVRIEKDILNKLRRPNIEDYILLYLEYFLDIEKKSDKKKVRLAFLIIDMFIENFDRDGTYISEKNIVANSTSSVTVDEISKAVEFINIIYGDGKKCIEKQHSSHLGWIFSGFYIYQCTFQKHDLFDILKSISKIK
jgi:hypothetical protein